MPLDRTRVEELEAEIDDEQLSNVRFGRSNFLRNAGLALFGLAAGVFAWLQWRPGMRQLQRRSLPPLPEKGQQHLRRKPLLENPPRLQDLPVLRLDQLERSPLHLPRFYR